MSGGSVTGGTGDIKPQFFTKGFVIAADQYTVDNPVLPVPRFGSVKNKATIFEVLKVLWYITGASLNDQQAKYWFYLSTSSSRTTTLTSTDATQAVDIVDPKTFALASINQTLATSGSISSFTPVVVDMTDNNGNGILVATDSIYAISGNVGGTAGTVCCKILYRLVDVGIQEYVGIVQSQQV